MISVMIPTLDAAATLPRCLNALLDAATSGFVREVVVIDAGSTDATPVIADAAGARLIEGPPNRGKRLQLGAETARSDWLLFLRANTILEANWMDEAGVFMARSVPEKPKAAAFLFALDEAGWNARRKEFFAALGYRLLMLPSGDQALLISKSFYRELGGFRPLPKREDVDLARRISHGRLVLLKARAVVMSEFKGAEIGASWIACPSCPKHAASG